MLCHLVTLSILLITVHGSAQGPIRPNVPPQVVVPPEFAEVATLVTTVDEEGAKLITILIDVKRPKSVREDAARWLGKLRYTPAIPALIQHITLYDPDGPAEDGPVFPCRDALQMYGDAAVPLLVDAYMKADYEPGTDRERCLVGAIARKSMPVAWTYAKGLAAENPKPDKTFQISIESFLGEIKPYVERERKKKTP